MRKSILYCILVHDSPRQTLRLLRAIYNRTDHFIVHVDQSAAPEYKSLLGGVNAAFPRIHVISNHVCTWGGYSLVAAELDMIRKGLELDGDWTHAMILSGTHLPVWPMAMIRDWVHEGISFMNWFEVPHAEIRPEDAWGGSVWDRFNYYFDEVPGIGMRRAGRSPALDFQYALGSQWVTLAREHASFAVRPGPDPIRDRFVRSLIADSAFFQTVICNSEFREQRDGKEHCTAMQWIDGAAHPRVLDLEGYITFGIKAGAPFIRKIAETLGDESEVERAIEQMIGTVEAPKFGQAVFAHFANGRPAPKSRRHATSAA